MLVTNYTDTTALELQMTEGRGQIVLDKSGNSCHAVSGNNLDVEDVDVTWTDRGAYFEDGDQLVAGENVISQASVEMESSVALSVWAHSFTSPVFLGGRESALSVCMKNDGMCVFLRPFRATQ